MAYLQGLVFGAVGLFLVILQVGREVSDHDGFQIGVVLCLLTLIALMTLSARRTGRIFLAVAALLTVALIAKDPDWQANIWHALLTSGFFAAFFIALTALRNAAGASPAMEKAGVFLARQPPGRRYLALTTGSEAFALLLNYGAIQLLGTLSLASARSEPDERIREIRVRRMLLAIHRGFVASLPWSPLSFSVAIAVAIIPGTSWEQVALPGLVTSLIILLTGWAVDSIFKPRTTGLRAQTQDPGHWTALLPLLLLMAVMLGTLLALATLFSIRVVGIVLFLVPLLSICWAVLQQRGLRGLGPRFRAFVAEEIPGYRGELLLITTAGFIGVTGSVLATPLMDASGINLAALPAWAVLLGLVWVLPLLGQIGANPILSMSLIAPLLPPAAALGVSPTSLAMALICGWALTGITSPFTAVNLLIGKFGQIRPIQVGWVWNLTYFPILAVLLCGWTLLFAYAFR